MRTWLRDRGLLLVNLALFVIFIGGMILTGVRVYNDEQAEHGGERVSLLGYLGTGDFVEATFENWESEFLQMGMYVVLTAYLFQRGSSESKPIDEPAPQDADPRDHADDPDAPWPVQRGGWVLKAYENSPGRAVLRVLPRLLAAARGRRRRAYSEEQVAHGGHAGDHVAVSSARPSSGSSRSRTGRASSWPWRPSWASRSTCGSEARPSPSRSPQPHAETGA